MSPRMFVQPGSVNTTEIDIKKACKVNNPFTVTKVGHVHIRQHAQRRFHFDFVHLAIYNYIEFITKVGKTYKVSCWQNNNK